MIEERISNRGEKTGEYAWLTEFFVKNSRKVRGRG
jgi:hypothetical protein